MHRILRGVITATALCGMVMPALAGKKKGAQDGAPITVELENACESAHTLEVGGLKVQLDSGKKSGERSLKPTAENDGYTLTLADEKPTELGLVALEPGGKYHLRIADCRAGAADVYIDNLQPLPEDKSPNAATKIRFRSQQRGVYMEYRAGKRGRFKPLSVAMTRYKEVPGGKMPITLRVRAARRGPVLKMFRKDLELKPGRRYLIEANVVGGREIVFKQEDEGVTDS